MKTKFSNFHRISTARSSILRCYHSWFFRNISLFTLAFYQVGWLVPVELVDTTRLDLPLGQQRAMLMLCQGQESAMHVGLKLISNILKLPIMKQLVSDCISFYQQFFDDGKSWMLRLNFKTFSPEIETVWGKSETSHFPSDIKKQLTN